MNQTPTPTPTKSTEPRSHKEELRQNDLAEFLSHMGPWFSRHQKDVALALLIVLVFIVFFGGRSYLAKRELQKLEDAWGGNFEAMAPEARADIARQHADMPMLHNMALLEAADDIYYEVIAGGADATGLPGDQAEVPAGARQRLEQALGYYQQVIDAPQPTDPPLARLTARLGVAGVYETLGNWDKALQQYELIRTEGATLPNYVKLADRLTQTQADRKQQITFATAKATPEGAGSGDGMLEDFENFTADPDAPNDATEPDTPQVPEAPESPEAPQAPEAPAR